jgi:hypothetical protein
VAAGYAVGGRATLTRREEIMQALREVFRFAVQLLKYAGQFLLSLLRLYRLAKRIKSNTDTWEQLPGQSTPVQGV